jgi:hypothetical protein
MAAPAKAGVEVEGGVGVVVGMRGGGDDMVLVFCLSDTYTKTISLTRSSILVG